MDLCDWDRPGGGGSVGPLCVVRDFEIFPLVRACELQVHMRSCVCVCVHIHTVSHFYFLCKICNCFSLSLSLSLFREISV